MPERRLKLELSPELSEVLEEEDLRRAVDRIAQLVSSRQAGNDSLARVCAPGCAPGGTLCAGEDIPIRTGDRVLGRLTSREPLDNLEQVSEIADALGGMLEHALRRQSAVNDLAGNLLETYSELNLLYSLLPSLASRTDDRQVGELLVEETARALNCRRVSLLVLDEKRTFLSVLASRGLPPEARNVRIPIVGSIAGRAVVDDSLLVVDNIAEFPQLAAQSKGTYGSGAFAVVRVPLRAQGHPLGVITVTERQPSGDFSAHDRKLLEAIAAMGASALMNCRLHAAAARQIMGTISALASTVDAKDHYTHDHSRRVAELCLATAAEMNVFDQMSELEIELAGQLHDIGKIGIPDQILAKAERLTADEFELIKTHVRIGAEIVRRVEGMERVAQCILHHHERYDGLGYPAGLRGDEIPVGSRLITVADAYDSLVSDRTYRKAIPECEAIREIRACRGSHFDPQVVDAFLRAIKQA